MSLIDKVKELDKKRTTLTSFEAEYSLSQSDWQASYESVGFSVQRDDSDEVEFDILIDDISEADAKFIALAPQMAQALIAVDDVLKEAAKELAEDLKDGKRSDGKRLLMLQLREAMEQDK